MHIHGGHMPLQGANLPSAAAAEKAAAARQAAEVRGRLMNSGPEMDSELNPGASWSVGRWPGGNSGGQEGHGREQSDPGASAGAGMDDSGQTGEPVSIWA